MPVVADTTTTTSFCISLKGVIKVKVTIKVVPVAAVNPGPRSSWWTYRPTPLHVESLPVLISLRPPNSTNPSWHCMVTNTFRHVSRRTNLPQVSLLPEHSKNSVITDTKTVIWSVATTCFSCIPSDVIDLHQNRVTIVVRDTLNLRSAFRHCLFNYLLLFTTVIHLIYQFNES